MSTVINPVSFASELVPDFYSAGFSKEADTAVVNSTLISEPDLRFDFGAYQRFAFRYTLFYTTNATADFKFRLAVPINLALWRNLREELAPAATAFTLTLDAANNGTTDLTILAASGTEGFARGTGILVAGPTAGAFQLQWSQNTTNAGPTTLRAGSILEYKQF